MELTFQTDTIRCLRRTVSIVRQQEERAEAIIPDSYPDAACVIDSYAETVLRGKDCRDGCTTISGGIKAGVMYQPEEEAAPRSVEFYLPFTIKIEDSQLSEQAQVICDCFVRGVEGRLVNSRKIAVRVDLGCRTDVYEKTEETLYMPQNTPECVQLKQNLYRLYLPLETGETSFSVNDTLELPSGLPAMEQVLKCICFPELTDKKLVGNKAVFKGMLHCKVLYADAAAQLHLWLQEIPFSQYCELTQDYDNENLEIVPVLTGYDLQTEGNSNIKNIMLTANLLVQCLISGEQSVTLIEDAYSTQGNLTAQWRAYDFDSRLDSRHGNLPIYRQFPSEIRYVIDHDYYTDHPVQTKEQDRTVISAPIKLRVLGYDEGGNLCSSQCTAEATEQIPMAEWAVCRIRMGPANLSVSQSNGQLQIQGNASYDAAFTAEQQLQTLMSGHVVQDKSTYVRPGLIVKTVEKDMPLWDVAKACGSTVSSIRIANDLDSERMPETDLLLIPIG